MLRTLVRRQLRQSLREGRDADNINTGKFHYVKSTVDAMQGLKMVRALQRGLQVLEAVNRRRHAALAELHEDTGLPKATLLRLLLTLEQGGYVRRGVGDGRYRLTRNILRFSPSTETPDRVAEIAAPVLDRLCRDIVWPSDVAVLSGTVMEIRETSRVLSPLLINRVFLGYQVPILPSAMGQAYLAACPADECEDILERLRRSPLAEDQLARDRRAVTRLLAETRVRGYGLRQDEYFGQLGNSAIAVAIRGHARVHGCISLLWVKGVLKADDVASQHLARLQAAAAEIAADLDADALG